MWPFGSSLRRIRGKIIEVRTGLRDVRLAIDVSGASANKIFTGSTELERLKGQEVTLIIKKIDTQREEHKKLIKEQQTQKKEVTVKLRREQRDQLRELRKS